MGTRARSTRAKHAVERACLPWSGARAVLSRSSRAGVLTLYVIYMTLWKSTAVDTQMATRQHFVAFLEAAVQVLVAHSRFL